MPLIARATHFSPRLVDQLQARRVALSSLSPRRKGDPFPRPPSAAVHCRGAGVYRWGIATLRRPVFRRLDDVVDAIERLPLPVFAIDRAGMIEWLNAAAVDLVGDQQGVHFSAVVAPESRSRTQDEFTKKLLGTATASEYEAFLVRPDGTHVEVEISSAPFSDQGKIVGVFGTAHVAGRAHSGSVPHHRLTPRQAQVLRLLAEGRSTTQIAADLGVARETARNHIRGVLRAFGVHSRLEAVVAAMREGSL